MADHPPISVISPRKEAISGLAKIAAAIDRGLVLFEGTVIVILLLGLIISVFLQVISRYIANMSNPWTEETARYLFVWVSMMGAALGVQRHSHFGFDAIVRSLPALGKNAARIAGLVLVLGMAGVIVVQGWRLVELGASETGPATNVPMPWVYAAIPVGGVLITVHIILSLFDT